eukprot:128418_1
MTDFKPRVITRNRNVLSTGDESRSPMISPSPLSPFLAPRYKSLKDSTLINKKCSNLQTTLKLSVQAMRSSSRSSQCDLAQAVKLPSGEEYDEWLFVNVNHFFDAAINCYGDAETFCTDTACKTMSAGNKYTYLWMDGVKYLRPEPCTAPQYIRLLFEWIDGQLSSPDLVLPNAGSGGFPKNFKTSMSQILRRLFRLYAHLYHSHYDKFRDIGADSNLDLNFRHFVFFIREFNLISDNDMMPLKRLIDGFVRDGAKKN